MIRRCNRNIGIIRYSLCCKSKHKQDKSLKGRKAEETDKCCLLLSIQSGIAPEMELFVRNLHHLLIWEVNIVFGDEFEINHWKCKYFSLQIAEL